MRFTKSVVRIFTTTIENNVFLWVLLRNSFGGTLCDCESSYGFMIIENTSHVSVRVFLLCGGSYFQRCFMAYNRQGFLKIIYCDFICDSLAGVIHILVRFFLLVGLSLEGSLFALSILRARLGACANTPHTLVPERGSG